jgi:hypothetical protein
MTLVGKESKYLYGMLGDANNVKILVKAFQAYQAGP